MRNRKRCRAVAFLLAVFFFVASLTSVFAFTTHYCADCADESVACLDLARLEENLRQFAEATADSGTRLASMEPPGICFVIACMNRDVPTLVGLNTRMNN